MKNFILLMIVLSIFLFKANLSVQAALVIPGQTCGLADDPNKNSCCAIIDLQYTKSDLDLGPLNVIKNILNFLTASFQNKVINPINEQIAKISRNINPCLSGVASTDNPSDPNCKCINAISESDTYLKAMYAFCQMQAKVADRTECLNCANDGGVLSAIGCIKTDMNKFIGETVFRLGIGLAGGLSLLCIIYAAFMMQSSQGNPEKLKKAQEMITSCIMGLMLIIFSVFILKLIGVDILKIPGFG